jgi:hypothetical protein
MAVQELTLTDRGRELQFATNHLGHFALALGLHDALAAADDARIVSVSSTGHLRSPVVFDGLDYAFRDYDPFGAYGQSKTSNVLFAVEAARRWGGDYMAQAGERFRRAGRSLKTPEQGAATSVLLATSPELEGVGGRYFEDCNEAPVVDRREGAGMSGVARYALDPANAERLWEVSLDLIR